MGSRGIRNERVLKGEFDETEIKEVVDFVKAQGRPEYDQTITVSSRPCEPITTAP